MKAKRYLVIDLEATCSEDHTIPRDEMETIEIGAVLVERKDLSIIDEFSTFVRPIRHPYLTEFCTKLTTITQNDIDNAPYFPEALRALCEKLWVPRDVLFCSWGNYDKNQFLNDCAFHKVDYPFGKEHLNLKREFAKARFRRRLGVQGALKSVGLTFEGTHHRGIDDARNIARLMHYIMML